MIEYEEVLFDKNYKNDLFCLSLLIVIFLNHLSKLAISYIFGEIVFLQLRLQLSYKIYTFKKTFAILIWEFLVKLYIVAINILYSVLIWKFKHSNAL